MITLCIPAYIRYDLLVKCIQSAEAGTVKPDKYLICDNGCKFNESDYEFVASKLQVIRPGLNLGCAGGWNVLAKNSQDTRIICNDDVMFYSDTIEKLIQGPDNHILSCSANSVSAFSLFVLPEHVYNTVGEFDETISPNYAYFEDNDYSYRMQLAGIGIFHTGAFGGHFGSASMKSLNHDEMQQHHKKFELARSNFIRKWGGMPGQEIYKTPYNA